MKKSISIISVLFITIFLLTFCQNIQIEQESQQNVGSQRVLQSTQAGTLYLYLQEINSVNTNDEEKSLVAADTSINIYINEVLVQTTPTPLTYFKSSCASPGASESSDDCVTTELCARFGQSYQFPNLFVGNRFKIEIWEVDNELPSAQYQWVISNIGGPTISQSQTLTVRDNIELKFNFYYMNNYASVFAQNLFWKDRLQLVSQLPCPINSLNLNIILQLTIALLLLVLF